MAQGAIAEEAGSAVRLRAAPIEKKALVALGR